MGGPGFTRITSVAKDEGERSFALSQGKSGSAGWSREWVMGPVRAGKLFFCNIFELFPLLSSVVALCASHVCSCS